jgi:hypothetical protein
MRHPGATAGLKQALEKRMEYLRVQLKVCEGCGGLWFRTQSAEDVYGRCCAGKLAQHAKANLDRRVARRVKRGPMTLSHAVLVGGAE